jgi:hypothetical protein
MENDGMESAVDLGTWLGRRQAFAAVAGRCSAADAECLAHHSREETVSRVRLELGGILPLSRASLPKISAFQLFDGFQVVTTGALRGLGDTRTPC